MNPALRQRVRAHPVFLGAMAVLVGLGFIAGIALVREHAAWQRAGREVVRKQRELDRLSAEAGGASLVEVETLRAEVAQAQAELFGAAGVKDSAAAVPAGRLEAFADLAAFVERNRARAVEAGVLLAPDERFGFAAYAREGPALEKVPEVWRQRVAVERLLDGLWSARPQALAGVWCGAGESDGGAAGGSLRVSGLVDAQRCRVGFVGGTACLRQYLASLAGAAQPMIVREVRAEPLPADARRSSGGHLTQFMVTLELLAPLGPVPEVTSGAVSRSGARPWLEPRAQSAGADWRFEIFAPPLIEYDKESRTWGLAGGAVTPGTAEHSGLALPQRQLERWRLVGHGRADAGDAGWVILEDTLGGAPVRLRRGEWDERAAITLVDWRLVRTADGAQVTEAQLRERDGTARWLRAGAVQPAVEAEPARD